MKITPDQFDEYLKLLHASAGEITDADRRVMLSRVETALQLCPMPSLCDVCDVYGDGQCLEDDPDFDPQEI